MHAQAYLQREIALVDPLYFFIWNDKRGRWQLRKWRSLYAKYDPRRSWEHSSEKIFTFFEIGDDQEDIGYMPINMGSVQAAREGLYWARHAKELIDSIDRHNQRMVEQEEAEEEYIYRYAAKTMWHHFRENRIDYGAH